MKISIRTLLGLVLVIALLIFFVRLLFVGELIAYHKDISTWPLDPGREATWTRFSSGDHSIGYVTYHDSDGDGRVDVRRELNRQLLRISRDSNGDGFFDQETYRKHGQAEHRWRSIHQSVPVTGKGQAAKAKEQQSRQRDGA